MLTCFIFISVRTLAYEYATKVTNPEDHFRNLSFVSIPALDIITPSRKWIGQLLTSKGHENHLQWLYIIDCVNRKVAKDR